MTKYVTNFGRSAIDHWSNYEAVREFIQNALDSDGEMEFELTDDAITLINKNIKVSNKMLMMGLSDKRNDPTKRGKFGTGSIFALCVLTARGIDVTIQNNDVYWDARFEYCDKFDEEVMVIDETPAYSSTDFAVTISGLSEDDINDIKQTSLIFQDRKILAATPYGDIIESVDDNGEVYCGDLFVKQTPSFTYSYNIKPQYLKLNQDRDSLSEWDLQTLTAKMIMASGDEELIKEAINSNSKDTRHVEYNCANIPISVSDDYAEAFVEEHGASLVTSDYSEHKNNLNNNVPSVYIDNVVKVKSIKESSVYQEAIEGIDEVEELNPYEEVDRLKDEIINMLRSQITSEELSTIEELFDEVLEKSDGWYA